MLQAILLIVRQLILLLPLLILLAMQYCDHTVTTIITISSPAAPRRPRLRPELAPERVSAALLLLGAPAPYPLRPRRSASRGIVCVITFSELLLVGLIGTGDGLNFLMG